MNKTETKLFKYNQLGLLMFCVRVTYLFQKGYVVQKTCLFYSSILHSTAFFTKVGSKLIISQKRYNFLLIKFGITVKFLM